MQTMIFSNMRQHLATAVDNHLPILITRQNKESVVMISLDDYRSMQETAYLMQSY